MLFFSAVSVAKPIAFTKGTIDFTKGGKRPDVSSHDWTLGATGMRGWCQVSKGFGEGGTTLDARQILVTNVIKRTPAASLVEVGDVILGVNGQKFSGDARVEFGKYLAAAEQKGKLDLLLYHKGKESSVIVPLPRYPAYSKYAPYSCEKSEKILKLGCDELVKFGLNKASISGYINSLALLSTGDKRHLKDVEKYVSSLVKNPLPTDAGLECWGYAFRTILLCEYYLITKDSRVLRDIEYNVDQIVRGQSVFGTWGHIFKDEVTQRLHGYGAVNAVGLPLAISLALAKDCNVDVEGLDEAVERSAIFYRKFVHLGAVPYGEGVPNLHYGHDDNGKNAAAAVFFSLLEDQEATEYFSKCALACYNYSRERGHAGNFTSIFWGLPAVSLLGKEATGLWMQEFSWYYDLARDSNFNFPYQGYPNQAPNSPYTKFKCPGAYLLHYALPRQKLRITGRGIKTLASLENEEIKNILNLEYIDYSTLDSTQFAYHLSSWSPIVREKSAKYLLKNPQSLDGKIKVEKGSLTAKFLLCRTSESFTQVEKLLLEDDLVVQVEALRSLINMDTKKAFEAGIKHISTQKELDSTFVQVFAETFFNLRVTAKKSSALLRSVKNREVALKAIEKLLNHEDSLVASRVGMGLMDLPLKETRPLFKTIHYKSKNFPKGNIMFGSKLKVSCTLFLAKYKTIEGLESAIALLEDASWGKGARIVPATSIIIDNYAEHAHEYLPRIEAVMNTFGESKLGYKKIKEIVLAIKEKKPSSKKLVSIYNL